MAEATKNPAIAHISEDGARIQTVAEHCRNTAELAGEFAQPFGAQAEAHAIGLLHDIGKYSAEFQQRILGKNISVDHSTAGAKTAFANKDILAAFAVAGHHGGIPDGGSSTDTPEGSTLFARCLRAVPDYSAFLQELSPEPGQPPPEWLHALPHETDNFRMALYTRMLFSCLVDADFIDTETFMTDGHAERGMGESISTLCSRFNAYLHQCGWDAPKRPLDIARWKILQECRDRAAEPRGLYTLTVPTGGGKTGASMAFALEHAQRWQMQRIIYVIPYTSIIEQNAAVFRSMLGAENVLEHHSNVDFSRAADSSENAEQEKRRRTAENFDAPVIVTTAVQFFESLFSNKPSRCRKLHNFANSVLIFDEAQMLPLPYLRPTVAALTELAAHYGCTVVLCTATQPSLDSLLKEYAPVLSVRELCGNAGDFSAQFRRVRFVQEGRLENAALAQQLNAEPQALCIVNSRKQAQEIFCLLQGEGTFHLSTLMTPTHREQILAKIRRRLKAGEPCRVVSTSLVEAGVDLDFPTVYRAEAGLDSILQAAGRCNREGKRPAEQSLVHIFEPENGSPALFAQNIAVTKIVLHGGLSPDDPRAIEQYFTLLHQLKGDALDAKHILRQWQIGTPEGSICPFRTTAEEFRLIEQNTTAVYIPTAESEPLLAQLRAGICSRGLLRKLGRYAVSVYPQHYKVLEQGGHLEFVSEDAAILRSPDLYSPQTGLTMEPPQGQAEFI